MAVLMKLVWGGHLGTAETWSCSLHGLTPEGGGASISNVATILKDFHARTASSISAGANLEYVKLNAISADGKYATPDFPITFDVVPKVAGGGSVNFFQLAIAVSTMTLAPRGRASKGRFFLPWGGVTQPDALTGTIPSPTGLAASVVTMMTSLRAGGFDPQVYSIVGQLGRPITRVRIGNVVDTQRRRRKSLTETYALSTTF